MSSNIFSILIWNTFLVLFLYNEAHIIIQNAITLKYNKWKTLNTMVSKKYESKVAITCASLYLIFQAYYISFLQYLNNTVKRVKKNTYLVTYVIDGKVYKMFVVPTRGPAPILQISDDERYDVTRAVLPFMGPNYNWHGMGITPKNLLYESLAFEYTDGESRVFDATETMVPK